MWSMCPLGGALMQNIALAFDRRFFWALPRIAPKILVLFCSTNFLIKLIYLFGGLMYFKDLNCEFHLRIPQRLYDSITNFAEFNDISFSEAVRIILMSYFFGGYVYGNSETDIDN